MERGLEPPPLQISGYAAYASGQNSVKIASKHSISSFHVNKKINLKDKAPFNSRGEQRLPYPMHTIQRIRLQMKTSVQKPCKSSYRSFAYKRLKRLIPMRRTTYVKTEFISAEMAKFFGVNTIYLQLNFQPSHAYIVLHDLYGICTEISHTIQK